MNRKISHLDSHTLTLNCKYLLTLVVFIRVTCGVSDLEYVKNGYGSLKSFLFYLSFRLWAAKVYLCFYANVQHLLLWTSVALKMDLEDDTTVLTTLKSFNSFIGQSEPPQRLSEHSVGCGNLQSQYKRSMEVHINLQHQQYC